MSKYPTINQLATSLGVAPSTVSRALKNHPGIGQKTKDRVIKKADEIGFIPNMYSNVLRDSQTHLIGLLIPDLNVHFYSRVLMAIEKSLQQQGYAMIVGHSEESLSKEISLINQFVTLRVDGVIAAITKETTRTEHFRKLVDLEIPLVFYERVLNFFDVPKIVSNDYEAAFKATKYLIDSGCRLLCHIAGSRNLNNSNNRLYGYLDAINGSCLEVNEDLILYSEFDNSKISRFLDESLERQPDLDGILAYNDHIAHQVVNHLIKRGNRVPEDISVIGYSDESIGSCMSPRLSTVEDISCDMGAKAGEMIIDMIQKKENQERRIVINQELILRNTTKELNRESVLMSHE